MAPGDVQQKDVVLAVFGAAVGLAGLLLVFLGFVVANIAARDPAKITLKTRHWYNGIIWSILGVLALACLTILTSLRWLLARDWFTATWVLFSVTLISTLAIAVLVSKRLSQ